MKKIIPFTNDIKFNTSIYEITSISLEHNLKLKQNNIFSGDFIISGDYKITDSSINTEPFINTVPFEITLDHKYDINKIKIDIDDFNYEVVNDEILRINISVKVDGVELVELEEEIKPDIVLERGEEKKEIEEEKIEEISDEEVTKEVTQTDRKEIDLFKEEETIKQVSNEQIENTIFDSLDEDNENYVTYYVHIVRENDNIEEICNKYKVTKEDIKEYNNLDDFMTGSKIIIPYINESV